jgi:release factor glutamine methyltransferase
MNWNDLVTDDDTLRIVEEVSGFSASELLQKSGDPVSSVALSRVNEMIERRKNGEPLQYVLSSWGFRELDLYIDQRVLIPRPETEVVTQIAIEAARDFKNPLVVDLGTGSGAIGLSVAHEIEDARVIATDVSSDALVVARANLAGLGLPGARVEMREGSWFEALPAEIKRNINLIVSNPPYIAKSESLPSEVSEFEPADALYSGDKGTECLELILKNSVEWLSDKGVVVLELAPDQAQEMLSLASSYGFDARIFQDLTERDRVLRAERH